MDCPPSAWLEVDLSYLRDKNTAPTAKAVPTAATQVTEESDICSTAAPPIPAPAAMASWMVELFKLSIMPEDSGASLIKCNCCGGPGDHVEHDHMTNTEIKITGDWAKSMIKSNAATLSDNPPIRVR